MRLQLVRLVENRFCVHAEHKAARRAAESEMHPFVPDRNALDIGTVFFAEALIVGFLEQFAVREAVALADDVAEPVQDRDLNLGRDLVTAELKRWKPVGGIYRKAGDDI